MSFKYYKLLHRTMNIRAPSLGTYFCIPSVKDNVIMLSKALTTTSQFPIFKNTFQCLKQYKENTILY